MNSINKKIVYRVALKFVSPINVSSGNEGTTDSDVMKDFDGNPFIPGTSIAGAFRAYAQIKDEQEMESLFGYTNNDNGKMSSLFISDLKFDGNPKKIIRDSVALDDNKISKDGAKFDFEALEGENTKGHFYMEVTIRDTDNEEDFEAVICDIFNGIKLHDIRLGSKKTRGYGIIDLMEVKKKEFDKTNYCDYASCYDEANWSDKDKYSWEDKYTSSSDGNYVHIEVPLELVGGISIRQYAVKKNSPDFEHITDHGKAVIPGTSFMGALRHRTQEILDLLGDECEYWGIDKQKLIKSMFGYVDKQTAHISNVVIDESIIEGAEPLTITRTGISRFESSAKDGALYQERTYVGGKLKLCISVKKENSNNDWMIGILLLAIKDLQNGFLAIGGQTSVGRGLFKANGNIKIDNTEKSDEEINNEYISEALKKYREVLDNAKA